jgi:hypothetical protein
MGLKNHCTDVPLKGIISQPNIMETYLAIQKLLMGGWAETGDLVCILSFLESRLKTARHDRIFGFSQKWSY